VLIFLSLVARSTFVMTYYIFNCICTVCQHCRCLICFLVSFWATICKTVRPMLSDRCLSCAVCLCNIGVLWPNSWMDQSETWHRGRPRPRPHCIRWGPSSPSPKGAHTPIFSPCPLWPNGWMDQDATWYIGRPRIRRHYVRWGPALPPKRCTSTPSPLGPCLLWPVGRPAQLLLSCCICDRRLWIRLQQKSCGEHCTVVKYMTTNAKLGKNTY